MLIKRYSYLLTLTICTKLATPISITRDNLVAARCADAQASPVGMSIRSGLRNGFSPKIGLALCHWHHKKLELGFAG